MFIQKKKLKFTDEKETHNSTLIKAFFKKKLDNCIALRIVLD